MDLKSIIFKRSLRTNLLLYIIINNFC